MYYRENMIWWHKQWVTTKWLSYKVILTRSNRDWDGPRVADHGWLSPVATRIHLVEGLRLFRRLLLLSFKKVKTWEHLTLENVFSNYLESNKERLDSKLFSTERIFRFRPMARDIGEYPENIEKIEFRTKISKFDLYTINGFYPHFVGKRLFWYLEYRAHKVSKNFEQYNFENYLKVAFFNFKYFQSEAVVIDSIERFCFNLSEKVILPLCKIMVEAGDTFIKFESQIRTLLDTRIRRSYMFYPTVMLYYVIINL